MMELLPLTKRKLEVLFEIYAAKENYLRAIAKETGMSVSLCARILNSLQSARQLAREKIGKEVYFSLSKKPLLLLALLEEFRLEKNMEKLPKLKSFVNLARENKELLAACSEIYVFGSYARGAATAKSDLDVLFITKDKKLIAKFCREAATILNIEVNGIVQSEGELERNLQKKEPFTTGVVSNPKQHLVVLFPRDPERLMP